MVVLTPELNRAVAEANGRPVRVKNEESHETDLLVKEKQGPSLPDWRVAEVSVGIGLAYDAFRRDLPEMLKDKKLAGKWALYHKGDRVVVKKNRNDAVKEVSRRKLSEDEYMIFLVEPEDEEYDYPLSWL